MTTAGHAALVVVTIDCQKCGQPFPQAVNSPDALRKLCRHCRRPVVLWGIDGARADQSPPRPLSA